MWNEFEDSRYQNFVFGFLKSIFRSKTLITTITMPKQLTNNNYINNTKKKKIMFQSVLKKLWEVDLPIPVFSCSMSDPWSCPCIISLVTSLDRVQWCQRPHVHHPLLFQSSQDRIVLFSRTRIFTWIQKIYFNTG